MKVVSIIILVFVLLSFGFNPIKTKVKITSKSEVTIKGKSNVNSFECKYDSECIEDEISVTITKSNAKTLFDGAKISIESKGFDCRHKMITKDFKKILKADDYSHIDIDLEELVTNKNETTAKISVGIAGIKKQYLVPITFDQKKLNVKGILKINIKDFALKSPKKLLGIVALNDNVAINFNLFLQY
ncbi:MAG: YceI family protein [Flavobacterium sp.]